MPAWCETTLKIKGESEYIYNFCKKHIVDDRFDFNTIIPEPETEEECPIKYNLNKRPDDTVGPSSSGKDWFNWYKWRNHMWGCKWNSRGLSGENIPDLEKDINQYSETYCEIKFLTPWSSPSPILDKILQMETDLEIEICLYYEMDGSTQIYGRNDEQIPQSEKEEEVKGDSATDYGMEFVSMFKNYEFGFKQEHIDAMASILTEWNENYPEDANFWYASGLFFLSLEACHALSHEKTSELIENTLKKIDGLEPEDKILNTLLKMYFNGFYNTFKEKDE